MIIKVMSSHILSCDTCGVNVTEPFPSWNRALDYIKENDWKMTIGSEGYDFKHICPNCQSGGCHD